jgi:hypothetical protein
MQEHAFFYRTLTDLVGNDMFETKLIWFPSRNAALGLFLTKVLNARRNRGFDAISFRRLGRARMALRFVARRDDVGVSAGRFR